MTWHEISHAIQAVGTQIRRQGDFSQPDESWLQTPDASACGFPKFKDAKKPVRW